MSDDKYTPNMLIIIRRERVKYEEVILRINELAVEHPICEIVKNEFEVLFKEVIDKHSDIV